SRTGAEYRVRLESPTAWRLLRMRMRLQNETKGRPVRRRLLSRDLEAGFPESIPVGAGPVRGGEHSAGDILAATGPGSLTHRRDGPPGVRRDPASHVLELAGTTVSHEERSPHRERLAISVLQTVDEQLGGRFGEDAGSEVPVLP